MLNITTTPLYPKLQHGAEVFLMGKLTQSGNSYYVDGEIKINFNSNNMSDINHRIGEFITVTGVKEGSNQVGCDYIASCGEMEQLDEEILKKAGDCFNSKQYKERAEMVQRM